jgi:hypothetical protein
VNPAGPTLGVTTEPFVSPATSVASARNCRTETKADVAGAGATNDTVVVAQDPPEVVAVIVADCADATPPDVAVNVAELLPAGTDTDVGTIKAAFDDDRVTVVPPAGAFCESVTVQAAVPLPDNVAGEHWTRVGVTAPVSDTVVCATDPFNEPVIVAVWFVNDPAEDAVNVAVLDPALTLTVPGTESAVELEVSAIVSPALATVRVIVQLVDADGPIDVGLHATAETPVAGLVRLIVPPLPVTVLAVPSAAPPIAPATLMATGVLPDPSVTETVATTPFAMTPAFMPSAMHEYRADVL